MKVHSHAMKGLIPLPVRLRCALRFWSGGNVHNLILVFRISYCEVFCSIDFICKVINQTPSLQLEFPTDHAKQRAIVKSFEQKSEVGFDNCVGCVAGLLIWMYMQSLEECDKVSVGHKKFVCGRKSKFGLNMQAICDSKRRFLNISILFGASASDMLAFEAFSNSSKNGQAWIPC